MGKAHFCAVDGAVAGGFEDCEEGVQGGGHYEGFDGFSEGINGCGLGGHDAVGWGVGGEEGGGR